MEQRNYYGMDPSRISPTTRPLQQQQQLQQQEQQHQQPPPVFQNTQDQGTLDHQGIIGFHGIQQDWCYLRVVQQPKIGRASISEIDTCRKPIDPPPVVQLVVNNDMDHERSYLQSPFLFVVCKLVPISVPPEPQLSATTLMGTCVSSLHRLKQDTNSSEGGYFIFSDLTPKVHGKYTLHFSLFEIGDRNATFIRSTISDEFTVSQGGDFAGLAASTALTRSFFEQGVRIRVRKEPKTRLKQRGPASSNYIPRAYNKRAKQDTMKESKEWSLESSLGPRQNHVEHENTMQFNPDSQPEHHASSSFGSSPFDSFSDDHTSERVTTETEQSQFQHLPQSNDCYGQRMEHGQHRSVPLAMPPGYDDQQLSPAGIEYQQPHYPYVPQPPPQMLGQYAQTASTYQEEYGRIPYNGPQLMAYGSVATNQFDQPQQYRHAQGGGLSVHSHFHLHDGLPSSSMTNTAVGLQYERHLGNFGMIENSGEPGNYHVAFS